ncbi:hypothetical protein WJX73_000953 [Symbiochloris irregularis]|uniref:Phospholipid-transporting ATPase n=1 Tax=Symbiochloris irregularis TaxID=706552 RepID=A0AAW1NND5_9CHLO
MVSTTKYNLITYLPKALYEQYRRVANIYFTLVAAISTTSISPVSPVTTFLPLIIVLGISMVKEAIEDFARYRADKDLNNRGVSVFDHASNSFKDVRWRDVQVGEVVKVTKDAFFPADLLLLSSSSADGICMVETINLDGESNLKIKASLDQTKGLEEAALSSFQAWVECEHPNASLYTFTGNLLVGPPSFPVETTCPVGQASVLLRGCTLRNTASILGVVVFAGHESKVMMNARRPPSKRSRIERQLDLLILGMFALLFTMCIIGACCFALWTRRLMPNMWYLAPEPGRVAAAFDPKRPAVAWFLSFVTSFVLYGYLIPISLYVSLEMVKVVQSSVFINMDRAMYHRESDTPAKARTSNLNEELGMVDTILSDKTGTLTQNIMEYFKCSIAGVAYGSGVTEIERSNARRMGVDAAKLGDAADPAAAVWRQPGFNFYDKRLVGGNWVNEAHKGTIREFLRVLAVCHTVVPDGPEDPAKIKYQAESPDESALVVAAKVLGFFFHRRSNTTIMVQESVGDEVHELEYEILNVLEFDSTRKRMSVICRTPDNRLMLYCKGADTVIYERLAPGNAMNEELKDVTRQHMEEFGAAGLRTLCLSYTKLEPEEYDRWQQRWVQAKQALQDRDALVAEVAEGIERNLILLGCTAIEDKLQQGVPETIERLAAAGIRLWVLTGDKQETAINIAFACSLLRSDMTQYIVSANLPEVVALEEAGKAEEAAALAHDMMLQQLSDALAEMQSVEQEGGGDNALIIDGKALTYALADDVKHLLLAVGSRCQAVVCCRVSPKQKAQVTKLVKDRGDTTLGIGDGANDVGMIQQANIGVGISGQEGMQAVMSSDFAIAQFHFLEPLLLVHGRRSYRRIARMISYFLYKNLLFGLTIFFYNGLCFFSGQILYNQYFMSLYNVVFTAFPPLLLGLLDEDVNRAMSSRYAGLYQYGPKNKLFNAWTLSWWLANACYQAAIMFAMVITATQAVHAGRSTGRPYSLWQVGSILFTVVIITVHLQLASMLTYFTWIHHICIWGGIVVWFLFLIVYGSLPLYWSTDIYHMFREVLAPAPSFWLLIVVVPIACVLPSFLCLEISRHVWPDDSRLVLEIQEREKKLMQRSTPLGSKVQAEEIAHINKGNIPGGPLQIKADARVVLPTLNIPAVRRFNSSRVPSSRFSASLTPGSTLSRMSPLTINSGFVPPDAPGACSYFTPRAHVEHSNSTLELASSAQRNPVIAALDRQLSTNPQRHRTTSAHLLRSTSSRSLMAQPDVPGEVAVPVTSLGSPRQSGTAASFGSAPRFGH